MKLAVVSHCAIDTITIDGNNYEQIGGAASYCGITARQFKFDVDLFTKFGPDFPKQYLTEHKINFTNSESEKNTTKFTISITGSERTLKLENECDPIDYSGINADGHIVSPIYHELSEDTFKKIKDDSNFLFVDPQGFVRQKDSQNNIFLKNTNLDLSDINAIKVNPDEAKHLVSGTHDEMMLALQKKGIEYVLLTNKTDVSLLVKDRYILLHFQIAKFMTPLVLVIFFVLHLAARCLKKRTFCGHFLLLAEQLKLHLNPKMWVCKKFQAGVLSRPTHLIFII